MDILKKDNILRIITSRPYKIHDQTLSWLDRYFPDKFEEIHFTNDWVMGKNARKRKKDVCLEYKIDIMIEDSLAYANECAEKNINVILIDTPWNQSGEINKNIKRVKSWKNIVDLLKNN